MSLWGQKVLCMPATCGCNPTIQGAPSALRAEPQPGHQCPPRLKHPVPGSWRAEGRAEGLGQMAVGAVQNMAAASSSPPGEVSLSVAACGRGGCCWGVPCPGNPGQGQSLAGLGWGCTEMMSSWMKRGCFHQSISPAARFPHGLSLLLLEQKAPQSHFFSGSYDTSTIWNLSFIKNNH